MKNHNRTLLASLLGLAPLLVSMPSWAIDETENLCDPTQIDNAFKQGKIQLNQAAKITSEGLVLTTVNDIAGVGTAFYKSGLTLRVPNTAGSERRLYNYFRMHMGPAGEYGLTAIIHGDDSKDLAFGSNGEGLGFGGIAKSIVYEFDNHADQSGNSGHVSLLFGSDFQTHLANAKPVAGLFGTVDNTDYFFYDKVVDVMIEYDHTSDIRFKIFMKLASEPAFPAKPLEWDVPSGGTSPANLDLSGEVGDEGWIGFTAAAGLVANKANAHWISRWQFSNEGPPCGCGNTCPTGSTCDLVLGYCVKDGCKQDADCVQDPLEPRCDTDAMDMSTNPPTRGLCAPCLFDDNCTHLDDPDRKYCFIQAPPAVNQCSACREDAECPTPAKPRCVTSPLPATCGECVENANCARFTATPVCGAMGGNNANTCVECNVNADCKKPELPVCDAEDSNTCVQCVTDADCKDPALPVCDARNNVCVKDRFVAGGGCGCSLPGDDNTATAAAVAALFAAAAGLSRRRRRS